MKKQTLALLAVALAAPLLPQVASAQLAFNVGAVSDYRYRGISQSRLKPALQGGVDYAAGGFYVGAWASTIKWIKDAGGDAPAELDIYGGYKGEIAKDLTFDVGVLTYQYPKNRLATSANTTELYGALTFGPATLKYSHSVSNLFGFADSKGSGYIDASATFDVGGGWMVTPHVGRQTVKNNGFFSYTDYSVGVSKDFSGLVVSVTAVGTDTKKMTIVEGEGLRERPLATVPAYPSPSGKNLGKAGVVLGVKYNF